MSHTSDKKIGSFMVAVGMVLEDKTTGKILVQQRASNFQTGEWEIPYGRVDQFEELKAAISRELFEETGLTECQPVRLLRVWHFYRGPKSAQTEVYGLTFHCQTSQVDVQMSDEHSAFEWVKPAEAINRIQVPGIKADVQLFAEWQAKKWQNFQVTFGEENKPLEYKL